MATAQPAPDAALWGLERTLETPPFVFYFRQHDAPAVIAAALQMDALYTSLRRNFGLPLPPAGEKLVIEVSVSQSPGTVHFQPHHYSERFVLPDHWVVVSPAVYLAPVELTDADLLAQSSRLGLYPPAPSLLKVQRASPCGGGCQPVSPFC
jgi:hypothetical protein